MCPVSAERKDVRIRPDDICSLTDFHRHARRHVDRLTRTKRPVVLTINGRARLIVQDAAAYESLLERLERSPTATVPEHEGRAGRRHRRVDLGGSPG